MRELIIDVAEGILVGGCLGIFVLAMLAASLVLGG